MFEKLKSILTFIRLGKLLRTRKETHLTRCHGIRSSTVRAQEPTKRTLSLMDTYNKGGMPNQWGKDMVFIDSIGKIDK